MTTPAAARARRFPIWAVALIVVVVLVDCEVRQAGGHATVTGLTGV